MTQKDTELIIDAIDFYNLNHLRGKETKKQLNKAKAKVQALNIHNVSPRDYVLRVAISLIKDLLKIQSMELTEDTFEEMEDAIETAKVFLKEHEG